MERSNATWRRHLGSPGPQQQAALRDLRQALLRGLRAGLSGSYRTDDAFLEDTVQDALLRILDRLPQFEGRSRFVTWATSIAIRTAMTERRRRRWQDLSLDQLVAEGSTPEAWNPPPSVSEPECRSSRRRLVDTMYEIIRRQLTDRQRTALLAELRGMPQVEIARQLGSNRNAVYKLTHDARKRLKRGLEAAGFLGEDVHAAFSA